jgi:hypothetical protein
MAQQDSISTLLATTMILSLTSFGYLFHYLHQKIHDLETKIKEEHNNRLEKHLYQSWSGSFADTTTSLTITLVSKKETSKKTNWKWMEWNGEEDGSVVNRNFYLGNDTPSFDWEITPREFDSKGVVKETFMDGWESVIQLKLTAFVQEAKTNEGMNLFLQQLIQHNQIVWKRCMISNEEATAIFE